MSAAPRDSFDADAADRMAAEWLARRDRGLTAAEQDDYLQWLAEHPRHGALIARHERTLRRMAQLAHWQPVLSSAPNADLFARPRARWWGRAPLIGALTAVALVSAHLWWQERTAAPTAPRLATAQTVIHHNDKRMLEDGSTVELREGSRIEVAYTAAERRVRLTGGEALFTVAKNVARPFIVEAAGVAVRAVGTAFVVRLEANAVDVVVTEGTVQLQRPATEEAADPAVDLPIIPASHRATVSRAEQAPPPEVTPVTEHQIRDVLAWQAPRFQFHETPLAEAVAEFNRRNPQKLVLGEADLARVPIGGTFRIDNVDGFVTLLRITLGVEAERRADGEIVLRRGR